MRGILAAGAYLPHSRLDRTAIAPITGVGGGRGTRTVASYDEDTTTMGVEAARLARRAIPDVAPDTLVFSTAEPAYLDKTNATTIHAALRLDRDAAAYDFGGAPRSAIGALRGALTGSGTTLVVASDLRSGLPGSADESSGGDGAAAVVVGDDTTAPVLATLVGSAARSEEFVDRWRTPGDVRSKIWEERFGETKYLALGEEAWREALKAAGLEADAIDHVIVTSLHTRAANAVANRLGTRSEARIDDLSATVGNTGTAHALLLLCAALEQAAPGQTIALVVLADGADVLLFRATDAVAAYAPARAVAAQAAAGAPVEYGKYLSWRGHLTVEPPRRPEPTRISASAAGRSEDWKLGFVAHRDAESGSPQLPPLPSGVGSAPMSDVAATIATFTVDRIAYSPSPPIVFAIVDFDGGGRFPIELTDVRADDVQMGGRVEMTFRRLFTADGIHNYFWKARPI